MIIESEKGKIEYQCANNGFAAVRLLNVLSKYGKEDLSDEIQMIVRFLLTFI